MRSLSNPEISTVSGGTSPKPQPVVYGGDDFQGARGETSQEYVSYSSAPEPYIDMTTEPCSWGGYSTLLQPEEYNLDT